MVRISWVKWSVYVVLAAVLVQTVPIICRSRRPLENEILLRADAKGAMPGRIVQIASKEYRSAFKHVVPKLGDCALKMGDSSIQECKEEFDGDEVFIPEASTVVDVSRVQSSEDILNHIMGALGVSVGVLGLASVDVKVKVAVTTQTSTTSLNLMSSYELRRGTLTLQNAHPTTAVSSDGTLFLSEILLGGNEILLVTIDFESETKKTEVELTVKVKILFITITAKLNYIKETFKTASSVRVQFISSWRNNLDTTFGFLDDNVIREVKKIEDMYLNGPVELSGMEKNDERLHNVFYFSAWNRGPYGENMNQATINADLESLKQQNAEISAVLQRIEELSKKVISLQKRERMQRLKATLEPTSKKLEKSLDTYHTLSVAERNMLHDIYGVNVAPLHYERQLRTILNT